MDDRLAGLEHLPSMTNKGAYCIEPAGKAQRPSYLQGMMTYRMNETDRQALNVIT